MTNTIPSKLWLTLEKKFLLQDYLWPIYSSKLDYGHVVMKNDLNKNMSEVFCQSNTLRFLTISYSDTIFPEVRDEVGVVFPLDFAECKGTRLCASSADSFALLNQVEWLPIPVYPTALRLVSRVNGKVFGGTGLHQNEEWIKISCNVGTTKQTQIITLGRLPAAVYKKHLSLLCKT